ncbi:DgyrCDS11884 [Dimorphilus gyrociliatus]|uniref:DgyrCDS11884 n=1 Tax=Dimorphilus gyrociliatus TaxID=2664684 RepID=A0A7I8W5N5_9ANNE|nr:DgyrCDS11884 [Dimorphilus gyrociliatus]
MEVKNSNSDEMTVDVEGSKNAVEHKKPMNAQVWKLLCLAGVLIYGTYSILVHLEEKNGKLAFSSASLVLVAEFCKLVMSLGMLYAQLRKAETKFEWPGLKVSLPFAIPAILYAFNNNISVLMQVEMDPATYQVLGNMKILSTAFLYRLIIKKPIAPLQWVALVMLMMAGASNSYGGIHQKIQDKSIASANYVHITGKGLIMISLYCFVSGLSGVYTELILKNRYEMSIHLQNSLLYVYGIIINGGSFIVGAMNSTEKNAWNLFHGYTFITFLLVLNLSSVGLIMAAIMKHGNNITRMFIVSTAMVITTALSMVVFGLVLNIYFCISFILVVGALYLYHKT